jgi:diaminopimelate epimerase
MPKKLEFTKMHGAGNDFVFLDDEKVTPALAKQLLDRHFGVGGDQLLNLKKGSDGADYTVDIWNSDGSRAEMCGNGVRAVAYYLRDSRGVKRSFTFKTGAGLIGINQSKGKIEVDMGEPILEGSRIPVQSSGDIVDWPLKVGSQEFRVHAVSMGNPHAVIFTKDLNNINLSYVGPMLENHSFFPNRVNVHFTQVLNRKKVRVRHWERGAGATLACGTGACAVVVAAARAGLTDRDITLEVPGGTLSARWANNNHVFLSGPAETTYRGEWLL